MDGEIPILEECGYDPKTWPPARGEYKTGDKSSGVAVVTLASNIDLEGAAIVGPCKTENLGVEKVVTNIISNSYIRFLIVCGQESRGHLPGDAIIALHKSGIDESGRIAGAVGAIPFIENLGAQAVQRFQRQIEVIDMIGVTDPDRLNAVIEDLRVKSTLFPERPITLIRKRREVQTTIFSSGDVSFGCRIELDTARWIVSQPAPKNDSFCQAGVE